MSPRPENEKKDRAAFPLLAKIINGGLAGIIGVTVVYPLDLVKTRLQNQTIGPNGERMYNSLVDAFVKIYKSEGYFGMYKGSGVNILLITPEKAIKLTMNDFFRYHLTLPDNSLPIPRQALAGGLAGLFQIVVTTPMELLKIQMQDAGRKALESKTVSKTSATQIAIKLLKSRGIVGLYRGLGATMFRDISFSVIYFPLFATLNDEGPRKSDESGEAVFWWSFISGLASGAFSAFVCTPLDVVKTRLQGQTEENMLYSSWLDCASKTLRKEGPKSFFKGGFCRIVVIAPLFGIAQAVYYLGVAERFLKIIGM